VLIPKTFFWYFDIGTHFDQWPLEPKSTAVIIQTDGYLRGLTNIDRSLAYIVEYVNTRLDRYFLRVIKD